MTQMLNGARRPPCEMKFQKSLLLSRARRDNRARNDLRHLRSSAAAVAVAAFCGHLRFLGPSRAAHNTSNAKAIPHLPYRHDVLGIGRVALELAPQLGDVRVDRARR